MDLDTSGIRFNDNLEPNFWQGMEIDEEARSRLVMIAKDFIKSLDLMDKVVDITLTGSLATYNWHDKSDIDLHILVDFTKISQDRELFRDFLDLKRAMEQLKLSASLLVMEARGLIKLSTSPVLNTSLKRSLA